MTLKIASKIIFQPSNPFSTLKTRFTAPNSLSKTFQPSKSTSNPFSTLKTRFTALNSLSKTFQPSKSTSNPFSTLKTRFTALNSLSKTFQPSKSTSNHFHSRQSTLKINLSPRRLIARKFHVKKFFHAIIEGEED